MAFDFVDNIVSVINNARDVEASGEINKQASEDMFKGLRDTVPNFPDDMPFNTRRTVWEGNLRHGEDKWCEENYGAMKEQAQHQKGKRAGEWKYRTLLPNPYTSAKNVIAKAIEVGVDPAGMGKSALNKAKKEAEVEALSEAGKFDRLLTKLYDLYVNCEDAEIREIMLNSVTVKFGL